MTYLLFINHEKTKIIIDYPISKKCMGPNNDIQIAVFYH